MISIKIFWDFEMQTDHPIPARKPDIVLINKKKRTCHQVDFAIPADDWVRIKENEKIDRLLDLPRELKKLWKVKLMVMWIVVGALGMVLKGLKKRLS